MIISSYYNKENKVLTLMSINDYKKIKIEDDIVYFLDEHDNIVGLNYFIDLNPNNVIIDFLGLNSIIVEKFPSYQSPFTYGYVLEIKKHPKSDKLKVCKVQVEDKEVQIVCGASNCIEGKVVVVAKVGAIMPNGQKILEGSLLGEKSFGMLCSYKELCQDKDSEGIILLDDKELIGKNYIGE